MCGRYQIIIAEDISGIWEIIDEINRKFYGTPELAAMKTGEICPTDTVPVVTAAGVELMTWGFPRYDGKGVVINARQETARTRHMFSRPLEERRVAIPTSGFFEWTREGKKSKDKYLFRLPGEHMLCLAGLWTRYPLETGKEDRFVILTTAGNASMRGYHDRMPVCIGQDERDDWINDPKFTDEVLMREQPRLVATPAPPKREAEQTSLF